MKNLFPAVLMLLSTCAFADEMQFITVLSTPVGSFNRLEAVDPSAPVQSTTVNFCTKIGTEGRVQLKGNNNVGIENANLSTNTTLGRSTAGDYVLQKITLNSAGSVTGSRLLSNVVKVSGQGVGKSDNLYGDTLTVAGAKTKNLNVGNGKSVMSGTGSAATMVWSNEYQNDTACRPNCKQQYLLKSKGSGATSGEESGDLECPTWVSMASTWNKGCSAVAFGGTITDSIKETALRNALNSAGLSASTKTCPPVGKTNQCSTVGDKCYTVREEIAEDNLYCIDIIPKECSREITVKCELLTL